MQRLEIHALLGDIVLVHHMAEEVPVIRLDLKLVVDLLRQHLEPVPIVATQGHIDGDEPCDVPALQLSGVASGGTETRRTG